MIIRKTLTCIVLAGALALVGVGCGNTNPDEKDIQQRVELYTDWLNGASPFNSNLEDGFIDPKKVVVEIRDQNGNGKREVVLNYEGVRYLMKKDDSGKVYLQKYRVKPKEIEPAEIIPQ